MGPLKKVLGMLPGVGSMMKDMDFDDRRFKLVEAMIQSMTPRERRAPDLIDIQRRRRIAQGSGNELDAVHGLVKQFKQMQKMMGKMGGSGLAEMMAGGGMPDPSQLGGLGGMPGMPGMDGMPGMGGRGKKKGGRGGRPSGLDDFLRGRRR
jgi:signal recognition particle subunit SRP54